jgi:hypothetical protein
MAFTASGRSALLGAADRKAWEIQGEQQHPVLARPLGSSRQMRGNPMQVVQWLDAMAGL